MRDRGVTFLDGRTPMSPSSRTFFLRSLGLSGSDALDPVVLAAVAAEAPLLRPKTWRSTR